MTTECNGVYSLSECICSHEFSRLISSRNLLTNEDIISNIPNSTCHPSIYRGSGQVHTQYSKSTLRVTMLPEFLLVALLASVEGLSKDHCLGYDVLCSTADYEFRHYNESVWVGLHVSLVFIHRSYVGLLYDYFKQRNSEGMEIQVTGQRLVSFAGHGAPAVYFMLPEELWDNPPTATDPRVFVTRLPMMDVFARKIRLLRVSDVGDFNRTLTEQNVPVNNSNFFLYSCMRYSRMFQDLSEGQELWLVTTGGFHCPAP
ncbi:uncharacterized protein LOC132386567 isoform X2 [Hypanus sabinus]|uniref:uncharacterized protein LOC132386567 isoform X2 n=1 Tax=Hypanus sabinus TaxID=79690 RepID=UPI0028C50622|nr:uncharacterized protein LOC132386567 isoform X2 [Hypanus sabinus]